MLINLIFTLPLWAKKNILKSYFNIDSAQTLLVKPPVRSNLYLVQGWKISWYFQKKNLFLVKNIKLKTIYRTRFIIRTFIQYKRKTDKQSVCFMAFYASLAVQIVLSVVWWMTISAVNTGLRRAYILWFFCLIFCLKISD